MPPTNTPIPHRKNAAEWLMWVLLQPVGWALRCVKRFRPDSRGAAQE
jgi:hypothetical protein